MEVQKEIYFVLLDCHTTEGFRWALKGLLRPTLPLASDSDCLVDMFIDELAF